MTEFKKRGLLFLAVPVVVFIIFVVLNMMSNADFEYAVELSWGYGALPAFVFWPLGLYTMFRKDPALLTPEQKKKRKKIILGLVIGIPVFILLLLMLDNAVGIF